jgi:hypothetical protein
MAITETLRALGGWSLNLRGAPQELLDALDYYGHIAIHPGRLDYRVAGDSALTSSRYTGVVRKLEIGKDETGTSLVSIGGAGMAVWLGDEDQKGDVRETLLTIDNETFEDSIRAVLPPSGSVIEGTLFNIGENFSGTFQFKSPREMVEYICETVGADWKVSGDAKLSAGLESDLFVTNPKTIAIRKLSGVDMAMRAFPGEMKTAQDVEDFTTRVVLLASTDGGSVASASEDIAPGLNPYRDIRGNPVKFTRLIAESSTDFANAPVRAQLQLNRFSKTRDAVTLSTNDFDVKGDLSVGDYIWVYDPQMGLYDFANEIPFKGRLYNPTKLRITEMTWPVTAGFSLGYRDWVGKWHNLTEFLEPEAGATSFVVGGFNRSLTSGADGGVIGPRPLPDATIPGQVVLVTPFTQSVYQSPVNGESRAQVNLKWLRPDNVDLTPITDGDHYDIRWRNSSTPLFPITHFQLSAFEYADLEGLPHSSLIEYPVTGWNYATAPWSDLEMLLQELTPSMPYEVQIRAVDAANPPNAGDWSALFTFQTLADTLPPATPAPPSVAASKLAIQLTHTLGRSDGGTYNLDLDLHHLDVHGGTEPNFAPGDSSLLGKLHANSGNITGHIPVVGTIPIDNLFPTYFKVIAVDIAGNASQPSTAVQTTAELVDSAHISDLTVTKVTAGTISSDWLLGADIATGTNGSRVTLNQFGLRAYNYVNDETFSVDSGTGDVVSSGNLTLDGSIRMQGAVRTYGSFGEVVTELGFLSDGTYGLALRNSANELLKISDFVFGPQNAYTAAFESCFNSAFTDLATYGPAVTVYIGETGRAMVISSAFIQVLHSAGYASPEITGATYRAATGGVGSGVRGGPIYAANSCSQVDFVDGLNVGWHTFTLKYRREDYAVSPDVADTKFANRRITVLPY